MTSDLQDARVLIDSLQARTHNLERKQRRCVALYQAKCHISIEGIIIDKILVHICPLSFPCPYQYGWMSGVYDYKRIDLYQCQWVGVVYAFDQSILLFTGLTVSLPRL